MRNAHATADDDAVHQGDVRFGIARNQVVELVFFGEKVFQLRVASQCRLVEETNIAACTEVAKRVDQALSAGFAHATNGDKGHRRVVAPSQQLCREQANHA